MNQRNGHFLTLGPGLLHKTKPAASSKDPELDRSQSWAETTQTVVFLTCGESVIGIWETSARVRKRGLAMHPFGRLKLGHSENGNRRSRRGGDCRKEAWRG